MVGVVENSPLRVSVSSSLQERPTLINGPTEQPFVTSVKHPFFSVQSTWLNFV